MFHQYFCPHPPSLYSPNSSTSQQQPQSCQQQGTRQPSGIQQHQPKPPAIPPQKRRLHQQSNKFISTSPPEIIPQNIQIPEINTTASTKTYNQLQNPLTSASTMTRGTVSELCSPIPSASSSSCPGHHGQQGGTPSISAATLILQSPSVSSLT